MCCSLTPSRKKIPLKQVRLASDSVQPKSSNRFHDLRDDQVDILNDLKGWAHNVKVLRSQEPEFSAGDEIDSSNCIEQCEKSLNGKLNFHITSEKDLEAFLREHPLLASVSGSYFNTKKAAAKAARKLASIHLEEDERLILLDSGSSLDAADIETEFPNYLALVQDSKKDEDDIAATTACGGVVTNKGKVVIAGTIKDKKGESYDFPLPFNNMKVQIPILSLRNVMKRGHTARLNDTGGYLRNLSNGSKVPVYEKEGVYYLKVKIRDAPPTPHAPPPESVFARLGR